MKKITGKNGIQKIVITILIVLSFNFIVPTFSQAGWGGILLDPVVGLLAAIPDAIMGGLSKFMLDGEWGESLLGGYMIGKGTFSRNSDDYPTARYDGKIDGDVEVSVDVDDLNQSFSITGNEYEVPIIKYSPEKIFAGRIPSLNANFITPIKYWDNGGPTQEGQKLLDEGYTEEQVQAMNDKSIGLQLQKTISSWYNALRNFTIVALLSVLLYVGIRIIISSASSDRAKYKQMLMDWVIALCLLFFLHYIMSFILTVNEIIVDGIAGDSYNSVVVTVTGQPGEASDTMNNGNIDSKATLDSSTTSSSTSSTVVDVVFRTDLLGLTRFYMQRDNVDKVFYLIMYIALVVYTCVFTWKYVKRAITMAFLTLMAPIVALTYPIDKMGDGKAQAFNKWLKEYIFNALLQPFHLILYTVFVSSAMNIAISNPIYAILFLAFITPAEKILRSWFKFDSASTAGSAAMGAFGGAAAFNLMQKTIGTSKGKVKGAGGTSGSKGVRTVENPNEIGKDLSAFAGGSIEEGSGAAGAGAGARVRTSTPATTGTGAGAGVAASGVLLDSNGNPYGSRTPARTLLGADGRPIQRLGNGASSPTTPPRTTRTAASSAAARAQNTGRLAGLQNSWNNFTADKPVIRGVGNVVGKPVKYIGNKARETFTTPEGKRRAVKTATRALTKVLTTAGIGAVGLGMGIAGDELEDIGKYGLAGLTLGATVAGNKAADLGGRAVGTVSDTFLAGYTGNEHAGDLLRQHDEQFFNEEARKDMADTFDVEGAELDDVMRRRADIYEQGITDDKSIKQTLKLENTLRKEMNVNELEGEQAEEAKERAKIQAITIAKLAAKGDYNNDKLRTSEEYRERVRTSFQTSLKKTNPSLSSGELKQQSDDVFRLFMKYKKIDY